ncbi:hypothetical protein PGR6_46360 [Pseudomonas sp. GR 6-02]|nr:hypothetical protein PGR6_46360 [Pseudomonas sp. GR 6-02]
MTNQQHQLKAPRSSCRHVCGFKLFRVPRKAAHFISQGRKKRNPHSENLANAFDPALGIPQECAIL